MASHAQCLLSLCSLLVSVASAFTAICVSESFKAGPGAPSRFNAEEFAASLSPLQPSPLSQDEICCFFAGLPSRPLLIARTGAPWKPIPRGNWQYPHARELRPVGKHPIAAPGVWENQVGPPFLKVLDEENVQWNTIDVHRIHYIEFDHEAPFPVVVCIGVKFGTLSGGDGAGVAKRCQEILDGFGLGDVEVAIKTSERFQCAAPPFEKPAQWPFLDKSPMARFHMPFTSSVGFPLSSVARPDVEGSGGFFFTNGEDTSKVFLLTARHAVIDTATRDNNVVYDHKSGGERPLRQDVTLFNDRGILEYFRSIRAQLGSKAHLAAICQRWIDEDQVEHDNAQGPDEREKAAKELEAHRRMLEEAQAPIKRLEEFYADTAKLYLSDVGRTLGFLSYSPPLRFFLGAHKYTEDVAVIEVDAAKIDSRTFRPNVLDMGSELKMSDLIDMLDPRGVRHREDPSPLQLPADVLLRLREIIPDAELRGPKQKDFNGDPCTMVLKRGKASGLTAGRLNNVPSYTRTCWEDGTSDVSMEWPVFGYRYNKLKNPVAFSEPGDSGAVVVDGQGRIAGIITGGAGFVHPTLDPTDTPTAHVTYITAADFIRDQMRTRGIDMNVNFTLPVD